MTTKTPLTKPGIPTGSKTAPGKPQGVKNKTIEAAKVQTPAADPVGSKMAPKTPPVEIPKHDPKKSQDGKKNKYLVIHCSASNLPKHDDISVIDAWHKQRGFKGVGYHFFITSNGTLQAGRPLDDDPVIEKEEIGAHVLGVNLESIGVCLSGIDSNDFTKAQFKTLKDLIDRLLETMDFEIVGHNFFTRLKTCPNFDWRSWVKKNYPDKYPSQEVLE